MFPHIIFVVLSAFKSLFIPVDAEPFGYGTLKYSHISTRVPDISNALGLNINISEISVKLFVKLSEVYI